MCIRDRGINPPTNEAAKHRIPFLFNILETLGIIEQRRSDVTVKFFIPTYDLIKFEDKENRDIVNTRINALLANSLNEDDMSRLRESFGAEFGTLKYYLHIHK